MLHSYNHNNCVNFNEIERERERKLFQQTNNFSHLNDNTGRASGLDCSTKFVQFLADQSQMSLFVLASCNFKCLLLLILSQIFQLNQLCKLNQQIVFFCTLKTNKAFVICIIQAKEAKRSRDLILIVNLSSIFQKLLSVSLLVLVIFLTNTKLDQLAFKLIR